MADEQVQENITVVSFDPHKHFAGLGNLMKSDESMENNENLRERVKHRQRQFEKQVMSNRVRKLEKDEERLKRQIMKI